MNEQVIVSKMHEYLHIATKELCTWLGKISFRSNNGRRQGFRLLLYEYRTYTFSDTYADD